MEQVNTRFTSRCKEYISFMIHMFFFISVWFSCCMMGSWPPSLSSCITPLPVMVSCVWSPHPRETSPTSSMYSMLWCQGWVSLSLSLGSYDLKHKHSYILDFSNTKFFIFKNVFRTLLHLLVLIILIAPYFFYMIIQKKDKRYPMENLLIPDCQCNSVIVLFTLC